MLQAATTLLPTASAVLTPVQVGAVPASASAGGSVTRSAADVVRDALAAGFRCFDCAQFYNNEKVLLLPGVFFTVWCASGMLFCRAWAKA